MLLVIYLAALHTQYGSGEGTSLKEGTHPPGSSTSNDMDLSKATHNDISFPATRTTVADAAHSTPQPPPDSKAHTPSTTQPNTTPSTFPATLNSIYIQPPHPFPTVDTFVQQTRSYYNLSLQTSPLPMKSAFAAYLQQNPRIKAIFVGTRRTDPHGGSLTNFDETDRGWPQFVRCHPVIEWRYREIWGVSFCAFRVFL